MDLMIYIFMHYHDITRKLSGEYSALTSSTSTTGYFYLSNYVCVEYDTYPCNSMDINTNNGGYTKIITLKSSITTFYFAMTFYISWWIFRY